MYPVKISGSSRRAVIVTTCVACLAAANHGVRAEERALRHAREIDEPRPAGPDATKLAPTNHPPLPAQPARFWLVPDKAAGRFGDAAAADDTALSGFARGVRLLLAGHYTAALPLVNAPALSSSPLADYARYYSGFTLLRLERFSEAASVLDALDDRHPIGYLAEAVALRRAELATAKKNPTQALSILDRLSRENPTDMEDVLLRAARAAEAAGSTDRALSLYHRVYFEFPLSPEADLAESEAAHLERSAPLTPERFTLELGRAERLFSARRYPQAREAFARLKSGASGDEKDLVALRIAESDYYLRRYVAARDALRPYLTGAPREAEARYFHLSALRGLRDIDTYVALARGLVKDFPESPWAEETLNSLGSQFLADSRDDEADQVFRDLCERFPRSRYVERAAWKIGWTAYKNGRFAETARVFEDASVALPRADTRPAWLYWAGRAHDRLGHTAEASARYRLEVTDYLNSYYGRLAIQKLEARHEPAVDRLITVESGDTPLAPTDATIRQLIAAHLYDDAVREVQYAQHAWGDAPALQATVAWIRHQQGLQLSARERFDYLRGSMNTMKRAYPQYLAAGGENLPPEVLGVVFPVDYWPLIKQNADAASIDPYLLTALIAQESTFTADIKSGANAWGLMQLLVSTGSRWARTLNIRPFSVAVLKRPETNVRLGTAYFKALLERFGGAHFALASYNAGENRVARWIAERPGFTQDEFIDDIPFPETQNYVKRILGTADDYRRLYGGGLLQPDAGIPRVATAATATATAGRAGAARPPAATPGRARKAPVSPSRRSSPSIL